MSIPRVSWEISLRKGFYEVELTDWSDAIFPTRVTVIWSDSEGDVYCLAETSHCLDNYSQLLFPGFATTCFEEMSYAEMKNSTISVDIG